MSIMDDGDRCVRCGGMLIDGAPALDGLPGFPCGFEEPALVFQDGRELVCWYGIVMEREEALGVAARILELAQ